MRALVYRLGLCLWLLLSGAQAGPININTASRAQLDAELEGVGTALAERIVRYREQHGPFLRPEDLQNVPYVGVKTFQKNRANILLKDP